MADIAAKLTDQFAACLAERVRGPAPASDGATAAPAPAATQAPWGPVLGGVAFGLILGLLLGHRRRIVIMTAAAPPGGYPPARTVL